MKSLSARNPLSIIALFISLIYGISALLLGYSVGDLNDDNQERLVLFIIAFPVAILFAFLYLVTWHHKKLYGPADFRSDEGFLSIGDLASIGEKYIEEGVIDIAQDETVGNPVIIANQAREGSNQTEILSERLKSEITANTTGTASGTSSSIGYSINSASLSYMIEGLVLQDLQNEFKSSIRRDLRIAMPNGRFAQVDGIIETPGGPIFVEIKRVSQKGNWTRRLRDGLDTLRRTVSDQAHGPIGIKGLLVLITDGPISNEMRDRAISSAASNEFPIDVRFYQARDLLSKYGLDAAQLDD